MGAMAARAEKAPAQVSTAKGERFEIMGGMVSGTNATIEGLTIQRRCQQHHASSRAALPCPRFALPLLRRDEESCARHDAPVHCAGDRLRWRGWPPNSQCTCTLKLKPVRRLYHMRHAQPPDQADP